MPADPGTLRVLACEGVRVGGTDADRVLSLTHAMPLLGLGSKLRAEIGGALHAVPVAPYNDLATWERIGFLQTPEMVREAARWRRLAEDPGRLARLHAVLDSGLGFDLAFAVEAGKIAVNGATNGGGDGGGCGGGRIDLSMVEQGLGAPLTSEMLARDLQPMAVAVTDAARRVVGRAEVAPEAVTHVVHVGGSSLLSPIRQALAEMFPHAQTVETAAFTAVAEGLALASGEPRQGRA